MKFRTIAPIAVLAFIIGVGWVGVLVAPVASLYFLVGVTLLSIVLGTLLPSSYGLWKVYSKVGIAPILVEIPCWYCSRPVVIPHELVRGPQVVATCSKCHDYTGMENQWTN